MPTLGAVLPIKPEKGKTNSLTQMTLLFDSYLNISPGLQFENFFIVSPQKFLQDAKYRLEPYADKIPFVFLEEEKLLPELRKKYWVSGWLRQQIIKLAIADIIGTDYYVTFDSDVVFTRSVQNDDLLPEGKALLDLKSKSPRPLWWESSGIILNLDPELNEQGMNVTPAILSTSIVIELLKQLSGEDNNWIHYLLRSYKPFPVNLFVKKIEWTEYSLYYLFAKQKGYLSQKHTMTMEDSAIRLSSKYNVWKPTDFNSWSPEPAFSQEDPGIFCVIQSNKKLRIEEIRNKLDPYIL